LKNISFFSFKACDIKPWHGKYNRILGNTTTFKIKFSIEKQAFWPIVEWNNFEEILFCSACEASGGIKDLVEAVNRAKTRISRIPGGAFVINEFGQVIVPSSRGDGKRLLVGEVDGVLLFKNPSDGSIIDLSDDTGLQNGDLWEKPYIGVKYNLNRGSNIYYYRYCSEQNKSEYLPKQDDELIKKLRKIRRSGAVRFIVNQNGLVLTKIPEGEYCRDEDKWVPVYVGRINYNLWFKKEE